MLERTACFTGHRPKKTIQYLPDDPDTQALANRLDRALQELCAQRQVEMFLCGMAEGFDLFAAQRLLRLRRVGRIPQDVCLVAVQPCPEHIRTMPSERWLDAYREVSQCAADTLVIGRQKSPLIYKKRNAFMVAQSRYVLAYWDHTFRSGTGQTVRMAQKSGRELFNLYDQELRF